MERLLTTREASSYLKERGVAFSEATLHTWRCRGRGPKYKRIMRSIRYTLADLDAFAEGGNVHTIDSR